jgi:hypothetical protein
VLGFQGEPIQPLAVVELKADRHLDRDRSNGRTAVSQLWDYVVNTPPECRWGVLSNIVSFRLYERNSTKRRYEHFSLQSLRDLDTFKQFYRLFHRRGLIDKEFNGLPRAVALLQASTDRQRVVGELYEAYLRTAGPHRGAALKQGHRSTWPSDGTPADHHLHRLCGTASC